MSTATVLNNHAHPLFNRNQPVDSQMEEHLHMMQPAPSINMEKSVNDLCDVILNNFKVTADDLRKKADDLRELAKRIDARADRIDDAAPEISRTIKGWMAYEEQGVQIVEALKTLERVDDQS